MKKVLHLLASNKYSGAENVVCTIIDNFKGEYDMAYCSPYGQIEEVLQSKNIKYYGMNRFNLNNLKKIIKEYNPDIIHAHDYKASVLTAFSGFKGKIISHLHINVKFAKSLNLKSFLYSMCVSKFDQIVGVSNSIFDEAIFKNKIRKKYITIYNFVDKNLILKKSNEYNFEKNYDLFFIGRLNQLKNPLMFVEIVKKIKLSYRDIKAVMIGDGELKSICIEKINKYDLNGNIDMLGFVENPFPIIKKSHIGIMPSIVEGFGLTAIEALSLDKPVLNSGVGGLSEIFKENKEFICRNVDDYVRKSIDLLYNKSKKNNYSLINIFFDKELFLSNIRKVYK